MTRTYEDLTDKQKHWLEEYVARGGGRKAAVEAAMVAYDTDIRKAGAYASRNLNSDVMKPIIAQRIVNSFGDLSVIGADKLREVLETGMWFGQAVKPADGLRAIKEALERGIGPVTHKQEITVQDNRTLPELQQSLLDKMKQLSAEDRRALGLEIIDVDAEEVPADEKTGSEELVDLRAPYGRRKDGTPALPRGRKPIEKRVLPGPDAYRPEPKSELELIRERMKRRKRRALRERKRQEEATDSDA